METCIKIIKIFLIINGILLILLGWFSYFEDINKPPKITNCYDNYNNEIIGEKCIEKIDLRSPILNSFIGIIFILASVFMI